MNKFLKTLSGIILLLAVTTATYAIQTGGAGHANRDIGGLVVTDNDGADANTVLLVTGDGTHASTTFNDLSTSNHTVTGVNQAHHTRMIRLGNVSSILFDEADDALTVPHHADFDIGTGDFTVEAWVYMDDPPEVPNEVYRIMAQGEMEAANGNWTFGFGSAWGAGYQLNFAIRVGGENVDVLSTGMDDIVKHSNQWVHLAVSRSSGTVKMFYNGIEVYSGASAGSMTTTDAGDISIGARWNTGAWIEEFSGLMDEVRFSDVARYTSDFTPVYQHNGESFDIEDANGNDQRLLFKQVY